jgi:hypothetical protein
MRIGIAADHGAFALKAQLEESLCTSGYDVADFGAHQLNPADDAQTSSSRWPEPSRLARSSVESRSGGAVLVLRSLRIRFLVSAQGSSMALSRLANVSKMMT